MFGYIKYLLWGRFHDPMQQPLNTVEDIHRILEHASRNPGYVYYGPFDAEPWVELTLQSYRELIAGSLPRQTT